MHRASTAARWLGFQRFRVGSYVVEKEGRLDHCAEITAILWDVNASVQYVTTGYRGEPALADLELVSERMDRDDQEDAS